MADTFTWADDTGVESSIEGKTFPASKDPIGLGKGKSSGKIVSKAAAIAKKKVNGVPLWAWGIGGLAAYYVIFLRR